MRHGWKTRIEERRYFEEKKKTQQEAAQKRLRIMLEWEREKMMMDLSRKNNFWSAFA